METPAGVELLRALFDHSSVPKWVYDRETLRFVSVNDAALRSYGYTREEFLAMTILDIRTPDEAARTLKQVRDPPQDGHGSRGSWRHRRRDGAILDVEIRTHDFVLEGRIQATIAETPVIPSSVTVLTTTSSIVIGCTAGGAAGYPAVVGYG